MRSRKIHYILIILLSLFSCQVKENEKTVEQDKMKEHPIIFLILTDDQGYGDLGCHGLHILKHQMLTGSPTKAMHMHVPTYLCLHVMVF